jgi:hypothetical protein
MEALIGFVITVIQPLAFVLMTGRAALGSNLKFWPRFTVGLLPPFIGAPIILCRRRKIKVQQRLLKPASSEEIFDPVLQLEKPRRIKRYDIQFLARA